VHGGQGQQSSRYEADVPSREQLEVEQKEGNFDQRNPGGVNDAPNVEQLEAM
jgi:hypothetical protein